MAGESKFVYFRFIRCLRTNQSEIISTKTIRKLLSAGCFKTAQHSNDHELKLFKTEEHFYSERMYDAQKLQSNGFKYLGYQTNNLDETDAWYSEIF